MKNDDDNDVNFHDDFVDENDDDDVDETGFFIPAGKGEMWSASVNTNQHF